MTEPLCPYFGECGGCTAQHISYDTQVNNKKNIVSRALGVQEIQVFTREPYYYRNRLDCVFHPSGIGLRKKGTWHTVVDLDQCVISNEKINVLMHEIRSFFTDVDAFHLRKHTGTFRYVVIRATEIDSSLSFVLNSASTKINQASELIKEFAQKTSAKNIVITYVPPETDMSVSDDYVVIKGRDVLEEQYLGKIFLFPVQGFFQNNFSVAHQLHMYCHDILKTYDTTPFSLLDLYAGVGTFGILNSSLFHDVTIIESVPPAIRCAEENIKKNTVTNARTFCLDARYLAQVDLPDKLFVICDPPRSGMHPKTIQRLKELQPQVILYVSCNVQQLAKEIVHFKGYTLKSVALFDMFPQTPHGEVVVVLVKE